MQPLSRATVAPAMVLTALAGLAAVVVALFMTLDARGDWGFLLAFRGTKVATMILVGSAIAVSTVLFQTVANNRILTPSIMGFDALYGLIQTSLVYLMGSAFVAAWDPRLRFAVEVVVMVAFSVSLYRWLFSGGLRSLHLLMLVGIVFGILFRSLSNFLQRIVDPNEFLVVQDRLFASFNRPDPALLAASAVTVAVVAVLGWRQLRVFDVLALGRDTAVNLGIDHRRAVTGVLLAVAVLVSVSTALVGPMTFLGLLVANLAYMLIASHRHALVLPAAALISVITLVGGQLILERIVAFDTALSVVIEFVGGLFFLVLLMRGLTR